MTSAPVDIGKFNNVARYEALMEVVRNRMTNREFVADYKVPKQHFEMILEAARHAPSGANAQPWHYIVVNDPTIREALARDKVVRGYRERGLRAETTRAGIGISTRVGVSA